VIELAKKALLEASKERLKQELELSSKEELNEVDEQGNTLLHLAVEQGALSCVKYLLSKEADISLPNKDGNSALHLAVQLGYFNIVNEMLGLSPAAKDRKRKANWTDKDRGHKCATLKDSQNKALNLLNVPNNQGEIPLIVAANLENDLIYKKLLFLDSAPGYAKSDMDKAFNVRLKRIDQLKKKTFWSAFLETFCPSASIAELTESFAYTGLFTGATAAVALGINIAFAATSIVGFSLIMYANYKKIAAEKNAIRELEELQVEQAFLQNIKKRIIQLSSQPSLTLEEKDELKSMKDELTKVIPKPSLVKGNEQSAADYVTTEDKTLVTLSSAGSFLCTYSGLLGLTGLSLAVTAEAMSTSLAALIVSTGPIGIAIALGVGLIFAGALAFYHYKSRTQNCLVFGEQRASINKLQYTIYKEQQDLVRGSENVLNQVDSLRNKLPPTAKKEEQAVQEQSTPELFKRHNHGHKPGELCSKETKQLRKIGFLGKTQDASMPTNSLTIHP
jgi:hypothetical protein